MIVRHRLSAFDILPIRYIGYAVRIRAVCDAFAGAQHELRTGFGQQYFARIDRDDGGLNPLRRSLSAPCRAACQQLVDIALRDERIID